MNTSKVEELGFWRGVGTLTLIFGAVTFLGSLVIAMGAYANQETAMAGPIAALMGAGIIVGLVCILIGWALRASDKPQPPVVINQYQQYSGQPAHKTPVPALMSIQEPMAFCPGCGRKVMPGAMFCEGCGRRLK